MLDYISKIKLGVSIETPNFILDSYFVTGRIGFAPIRMVLAIIMNALLIDKLSDIVEGPESTDVYAKNQQNPLHKQLE